MNYEVKHNAAQGLFYIDAEGKRSQLKYYMEGGNIMDITSTYVPSELRGKGFAAQLVEEAIKYAKENKYSIIPSCSYVYAYILRHPEYKELVVEE